MKKGEDKKMEDVDKEDKCKNEDLSKVNKKLDVGALNLSTTILTNILDHEENIAQTPAGDHLKPKTNLLPKVRLDKKVQVKETGELDTEAIRISEIILTNVTEDTSAKNKNPDLDLKETSKSNKKEIVEKAEKAVPATRTTKLLNTTQETSVKNKSHDPQENLSKSSSKKTEEKKEKSSNSLEQAANGPDTVLEKEKRSVIESGEARRGAVVQEPGGRTEVTETDPQRHRPVQVGVSELRQEIINKRLSRVQPALAAESVSRHIALEKEKSHLDREIEALERKQAAKLDRINENQREKKIDLSRTDVNANRPSVLGPSRFDVPGFSSYKPSSSEAPRRTENQDLRSQHLSRSVTTGNVTNTPEQRRKRFDNNFNAVPEPFKSSSKPTVSDSSVREKKSVGQPAYFPPPENSYQPHIPILSPSFSVLSSLPSPSTYTGPYSSTLSPAGLPSTSPPASSSFQSSTLSKTSASRAKSEGSGLSGSSQYKEFYHQIQASKDKYKSDMEKAMSFDRTLSKPPIIRDKLPRPDATPLLSRRQERRQEREATVITAIVSDRAKRGKSDDLLRSSTFRF